MKWSGEYYPQTYRLAGGRVGLCRLRPGTAAGMTVVCFPFSGGGPLALRAFAEALPSEMSVWGLDSPGHVRTSGTPLARVEGIAETFLDAAPPGLFADALLYGHSVGGYVVHALARRLVASGTPPRGVVLGGTIPPSHRVAPGLGSLSDADLAETLAAMGHMPSDLFQIFRGAIRADLDAFDRYAPPALPLDLPALVLCAEDDRFYPVASFEAWRAWLPSCTIRRTTGGHLFVAAAPDATARHVADFARPFMERSVQCQI